MSLRTERDRTVTQAHTPTKADRIRDLVSQDSGKAVLVKMPNGKEYYVVNLTGGSLANIPNARKVAELAKLVIAAHDDDFERIDSEGAHYADKPTVAHTEKGIQQQALHEASEGISVKNDQLTKPQQAVVDLDEAISGDKTADEVRGMLVDPDLPQEFNTALTSLVRGKDGGENVTQADIQDAFNKVRDEQYIPRLQQEHTEGKAPGVDTDFASVASKPTTGEKLLHLNTLTQEQRTAQHAWNAMLKEAHVTQRTSLPQILGEDLHIVEVHPHHEVDPLLGIEIVPTSRDSLHPQRRSSTGTLVSPLTPQHGADSLEDTELPTQVIRLKLEARQIGIESPPNDEAVLTAQIAERKEVLNQYAVANSIDIPKKFLSDETDYAQLHEAVKAHQLHQALSIEAQKLGQVAALKREAAIIGAEMPEEVTVQNLEEALKAKYRERTEAHIGYYSTDIDGVPQWKEFIPQDRSDALIDADGNVQLDQFTLDDFRTFQDRQQLLFYAHELGLYDDMPVHETQQLSTEAIANAVFDKIKAVNPDDAWKAYLPASIDKEDGFNLDELKVIIFRRAVIMEANKQNALEGKGTSEIQGMTVDAIEQALKGKIAQVNAAKWGNFGGVRNETYDEALFKNPFGLRALEDLAKID